MSERAEVCCVCGKSLAGKSLAGQITINRLILPDGQGYKSDFCSVECIEKYLGHPCIVQHIGVKDSSNED